MKQTFLILFSVAAIFTSCKKHSTPPIMPVDAGLKSGFGYKPGSYWIYKDSVSGAIDSAYVYAETTDYYYHGCVLFAGQPKFESINIALQVASSNSLDTERWNFYMEESKFSIGMYHNNDKVESSLGFCLFTWPLDTGIITRSVGCLLNPDSGAVTNIMPALSLNGQEYAQAARCFHSCSQRGSTDFMYSDYFYVSKDAGLVKVIFHHPSSGVQRVLELQRYHLVR